MEHLVDQADKFEDDISRTNYRLLIDLKTRVYHIEMLSGPIRNHIFELRPANDPMKENELNEKEFYKVFTYSSFKDLLRKLPLVNDYNLLIDLNYGEYYIEMLDGPEKDRVYKLEFNNKVLNEQEINNKNFYMILPFQTLYKSLVELSVIYQKIIRFHILTYEDIMCLGRIKFE